MNSGNRVGVRVRAVLGRTILWLVSVKGYS